MNLIGVAYLLKLETYLETSSGAEFSKDTDVTWLYTHPNQTRKVRASDVTHL